MLTGSGVGVGAISITGGPAGTVGVAGSGGLPNPGSLGGFIPGFAGRNFGDLVENEAEFREWVLDGESSRLAANPLLRYFWRRQQISMPAYRERLAPEEIDSLWKWVLSLQEPLAGS